MERIIIRILGNEERITIDECIKGLVCLSVFSWKSHPDLFFQHLDGIVPHEIWRIARKEALTNKNRIIL